VDSIEHGTWLDEEGAKLIEQHGTWLVPTLYCVQREIDWLPGGTVQAQSGGAFAGQALGKRSCLSRESNAA
jgi:imidazolonepropionase-like amidohydrolase